MSVFGCCDESGIHSKSRWWTIGAVWLPDDQVPDFEARAIEVRQHHKCWGEIKWGKVEPRMLDAYSDLLKVAFSKPFDLRFNSIVIDSGLFAAKEMKEYHGDGGTDEAFLKFMRLLLSHRVKYLVGFGHTDFTLLYDKLSVNAKLQGTLRDVLKRDLDNISIAHSKVCEYSHLSQADSKVLSLMQVADLLTGATWTAWEGSDPAGNPKKAEARKALRDQIELWADGSLKRTSFPASRYYNLWKWKPKS